MRSSCHESQACLHILTEVLIFLFERICCKWDYRNVRSDNMLGVNWAMLSTVAILGARTTRKFSYGSRFVSRELSFFQAGRLRENC